MIIFTHIKHDFFCLLRYKLNRILNVILYPWTCPTVYGYAYLHFVMDSTSGIFSKIPF